MGHGTSVVVCGHDPHDDIIGNMAVGSDLRIGASWLADVGGVASASRAWRFCRVLPVRTCSIAARPRIAARPLEWAACNELLMHSGAWASSIEWYPAECRAVRARARAMPMPRTTPARHQPVERSFGRWLPTTCRHACRAQVYASSRQIMVIVPRNWRHPHPPPAHTTLCSLLST
jgi:hypothetical protein